MSITGLPGTRPYARRYPDRRSHRRTVCCARHSGRAAGARKSGKGQAVTTSLLQAQIFMLDFQAARYLVAGRGRQAGRQQSSDFDPDRRVQDQGWLHQHRHSGGEMWDRLCEAIDAAEVWQARGLQTGARARKIATRSTPRSRAISRPQTAPSGSNASTRPACRAGRSIPSTRCSPIRRCGISASRRPSAAEGKALKLLGAAGVAVAHAVASSCARPPAAGRAYRRGAQGIRLLQARDRRAAQGKGDLSGLTRGTARQGSEIMPQTDKISGAQGSGRWPRHLQQSRAPQRCVARDVGGEQGSARWLRRRQRGARRGAHRRRRQGVRLRRRYFQIRQRARFHRSDARLRRRHRRGLSTACTNFPSRPSP